jgi:hypothetical protein
MEKSLNNPYITVKVKGEDRKLKLRLQHALALLQLKNSMWEISDNEYRFLDNDIKRITSPDPAKKPRQ